MTIDHDATVGASALYAFAQLLEAEGAVYQRVLQRGPERSTTAEAMRQAASMARQTAYQVERKGLEYAMRNVPQLPEGDALARAVEAARISWFRSVIGRDPQPHEFQHHQGMAMRNAILAAWPHLRAAALQLEDQA
ncbi:hypothetical protein [Xanthomonas citri]|uniref:hypothetical protein n=1 Tax=Xanthomonas citri TaxID=346 RepID=UPI0009C1CF6B|nr:hypothetical protein [Xanthomonas citri]AMV00067.1 hypothetical protein TP37_19800 [Xanthomonas citri pv. aurantifolii]AMV02106.1 hypothetical protein TP50_06335 [Xanthomonas citri pv. aurantifolii]MCC8492159.1 hypothetical protein [Xanthomonas citri pv. fuscans]TBW92958.1 hypothetical protein TP49_23675 [Xanthomonas citri pv. aurantifolii]